MKYVITGGAGFIGSHLAIELLKKGNSVIVIDNMSTGRISNLYEVLGHPNITLIEKDVNAINDWRDILSGSPKIFHLAATVGVDKVCCDPIITVNNNFQPTLKLLKLANIYSCDLFFTSTSETYGELQHHDSQESDNLVVPGTFCGRSAYVLGKILSEQYCINYSRQFNCRVIVTRLFNVIGPNQADAFGMVVPNFIKQALRDEPITVFGDGSQTRCFCDVSDIVKGILSLTDSQNCWGEVFNLGGIQRISILELAKFIKTETGSTSPIIFKEFPSQRSEGRDILHRKGDMGKIGSYANWAPSISWQNAVRRIINLEKSKASSANSYYRRDIENAGTAYAG